MSKRPPADTPENVLFIGNSFTARNDLPGQIANLAKSRGHDFAFRLISAGGASLRQHLNGREAHAAIRDGGFTHVVLQEQSTLPIKNAKRMHENVREFDAAIRSAGSNTVLCMTWARRNVPESQQLITDAYTAIGKELCALVVPVGLAWQRFLGKHSQPALHDPDQSHPTPAGTYLAACVFLAALFNENPVGADYEGDLLPKKDRVALQRTAWATWKSRSEEN